MSATHQINTSSQAILIKGAIWTIAWFGINQSLRVVTNVILTRLLAPELFGIMQIINSLRIAIQLLSDVGIGQNIIYHKEANSPAFYNTAWTVQVIRSILLWLAFWAAALPISRFYGSPLIGSIIPIAGLNIILTGFTSVSIYLLEKRMRFKTLTAFNTIIGIGSSVGLIIAVYFNRTIWGLVYGSLVGSAISLTGSFFVLPDVRLRLFISTKYALEIFSFGKWIFVSSIVYFLSGNFDRLYLAKVVPLAVLGVYGIARGLSDMLTSLIVNLSNQVVFPLVASQSGMPRTELRRQLAPIRMKFLVATAVGIAILVVGGDVVVGILYDKRYHAAGWMLPILIVGAWFGVLASLNESLLLGIGRPQYSAASNSAKCGFLVLGLIVTVVRYGVVGGVIVVAASEFFRYISLLIGQIRERLSFRAQDILVTAGFFSLIVICEFLRWEFGFGTSFGGVPIEFR